MKIIPKSKWNRQLCPEKCRYRDRAAPFCGFCMLKILGPEQKEEMDNGKPNEKNR